MNLFQLLQFIFRLGANGRKARREGKPCFSCGKTTLCKDCNKAV